MKKSVKKYFRSAAKKVNKIVRFTCTEAQILKEDLRGESQNTASAGAIIMGLLLAALSIGWATGFLPNVVFPKIEEYFNNLWG